MRALVRRLAAAAALPLSPRRCKTTSAQYVAARAMDATFEKLMDGYKNLLKVTAVQDLVLASPSGALPLSFLSSAAQKLHLNRGAPYFVRRYPHIFSVSGDAAAEQTVRLTEAAAEISRQESLAAADAAALAVERLVRLLSMSPSRTVPLRAVFKVWRELGLPDDFEDSVISRNPRVFSLRDNPREPNTHLLQLVGEVPTLTPAVERWRNQELAKKVKKTEEEDEEIRYAFKQEFPPGMKLKKNFRAAVKEWQRLPYPGPYDGGGVAAGGGGGRTKAALRRLEKRAVGIAHEFLDLTVEKMVEVEKMSQFRKWLAIELNIRDLFLDHPGIFYLSTKGKKHTVFLREAYDRGRLVNPNPLYDARRNLLHLVLLGKRGSADSAGEAGGAAAAERE
ncbi:unnamed protein product [Spirodela intermedia]|uniref:PORR domain-containing protein n=1 Tax=Spirodela intermedia TaxID=51605 RepID=A0A7I8J8S7_SPIIN|nr:unnamed protein product [Spirodela intermedia]CAA6666616.1 unnamed protein product [Spirodela intermedia]